MLPIDSVQKGRLALRKEKIDPSNNMLEETRFPSQNRESNLNIRDQIINEIINRVKVMNIKELDGWEGIQFEKINTLRNQSNITTEELFVLQDFLDNKFEEMQYQIYLAEYYFNNNESNVGSEEAGTQIW